jgi:hypothetical protein
MKSETIGKSTLKVEVTNMSMHGIWILISEREYFLPYVDFPWFKEAKIAEAINVEVLNETHLFWPDLDVDLDLEMLNNVENYPLIYHSK